jgi:hypothetical protein
VDRLQQQVAATRSIKTCPSTDYILHEGKFSLAYGFSSVRLTEVGKESEEDQLAPMVLQRLWSLSPTKVSFILPS